MERRQDFADRQPRPRSLNLQHYNSKQAQGFLLHPSVKLSSDSPVIADIGTGTGIWLLDLAETLPATAQFHGFDIDLAQTPPKEWLPDNVSMKQLDIFGPIPDDLVGRFGELSQSSTIET